MKHFYSVLFCAMLWSMSVNGQYLRLTASENAFRAGDMLVKTQVEYRDAGASGLGIIWDFTFLQPINEMYDVNYFHTDSADLTLFCGREPDARYYYQQSGDTIKAIGFENNTAYMHYFKPEIRLKFPLRFGDTLYSAFAGSGQYGLRVPMLVEGYTRVHYDADGTLKIPDYPDGVPALRVHTQNRYTQASMDSLQMKIDTWSWYVQGTRYPVFESVQTSIIYFKMLYNGDSIPNDTTNFQTSFYYPPSQQVNIFDDTFGGGQSTGIHAVFTDADWQPNPVIDNLQITYRLTRNAMVWFTVHANGGIPLCQTSPSYQQAGNNETVISMSHLMTGSYTVYVHVDDMVLMQTIIKR
ncbi:MAG: hypothetical protein LBS16_07225 [Prevotellaceae bacterium]|jgi:hypothetical protein|nr:hypothetical protein [Prevotellaceae bacterium]